MAAEAAIDAITKGMTQDDVLATAGEPDKVLPTESSEPSFSVSWLYRDTRHSGGYTYVYFDHGACVALIRGSVSIGTPFE